MSDVTLLLESLDPWPNEIYEAPLLI